MSVDEYYEIKNKYDFEIKTSKARKKIIKNNTLSIKEKRSLLSQLKHKCISCERPVGTIFKTIFDSDKEFRILTARCGDKLAPCKLNIQVNPGSYNSIPSIIDFYEAENEKIKQDVITIKNQTLFGFMTNETAIDEYNKIKEDINNNAYLLDKFISLHNDIVNNKEKDTMIRNKMKTLYSTINVYKEHVDKYDETQDTQDVLEAVRIYDKQISPLLKEISSLKYENVSIHAETKNGEGDEDENDTGKVMYHLVQQKYSTESMEFNDHEPEVISWSMSEKNNF
jgi:hypothetical protein